MIFKKFRYYMAVALIGNAMASACGTPNSQVNGQADPPELLKFDQGSHNLIAKNFVHTMAQLPGLAPIPTTIQMMDPSTPFGRAMEHNIIETGYGYQIVEGDMGRYFLRYRVEGAETQVGYTQVFQVSIGEIELEREFQLVESHLTPVSPMRVSGVDTDEVELNDDIFRFNNPHRFRSEIEIDKVSEPAVAELTDKARLPVPFAMAGQSMAKSTIVSKKEPERDNPNVFDKGESNYEDVFNQFTDVSQLILVFANDSDKLSNENWRKMLELIELFDSTRDIFSVVGCSLGRTTAGQGNIGLATSRTNRVKQALISGGVDAVKIYDESCWGTSYRDEELPRRGAILTLKRRIN